MELKLKIATLGIWLTLIFTTYPAAAQLLRDTATLELVKKDIDCIYNQQFNDAREIYTRIVALYPEHSVVYLLKGLITYWENFPLLSTSPAKESFEEDLRRCISISENNNNPDWEAEYLLANLCARGMLLLFYCDNHLVMDVIPLTSSTYKYLMRSFDYTGVCTDLYYFTGVYNYYRDAYPRVYPVYKPLALLFPPGDMQKGLYELKRAGLFSVVMRAESYYLLTLIYVDFENNYYEGLNYSKSLHDHYPGNMQYLANYIRNLLLLKNYDEAGKLIDSIPDTAGNRYFQAQITILKAILQEKKFHDYRVALLYYNKGINDISFFGDYGNGYAAYAYFGLSRISDAQGEKHQGKIYRKEALRRADFEKIDFE